MANYIALAAMEIARAKGDAPRCGQASIVDVALVDELGFDSLDMAELEHVAELAVIEAGYCATLPELPLQQARTPRQLAALIAAVFDDAA